MIQGEDNRRQTGQVLLCWNGIPFCSTHCKTYTRGWNDPGMEVIRVMRVIRVIRVIRVARVICVVCVGWKVPLIRKVGTTLSP